MAITTWINESERERYLNVKEEDVNGLYQLVRATKPNIYLSEVYATEAHTFKPNRTYPVYIIYNHLGGTDAQVINLYGLGGPYEKEVILGFLVGCLTEKAFNCKDETTYRVHNSWKDD